MSNVPKQMPFWQRYSFFLRYQGPNKLSFFNNLRAQKKTVLVFLKVSHCDFNEKHADPAQHVPPVEPCGE